MGLFDFFARRKQRAAPEQKVATRPVVRYLDPVGVPVGAPPTHLAALAGIADAEVVFVAHSEDAGDIWALRGAMDPVGAWHRLTAEHDRTGWCPVLLTNFFGDFFDVEMDAIDGPAHAESGLHDGRAVLDRLRVTTPQSISEGSGPFPEPRDDSPPDQSPLLIVLIRTPDPWRVPEKLGYLGAVNLGIEPWEHAAALKLWHEQHGARVLLIDEASYDLWVPEPPTDPETALAIARDHAGYCPDAIEPGTLREWTAVVRSRLWPFWWD